MYIQELALQNFRNYEKLAMVFSPAVNIITGENGTGKTNILEAISICAHMKSFRNIADGEIMRWGEGAYFCSSSVGDSAFRRFEVGSAFYQVGLRKRGKIDGVEINRIADYYGRLLVVIFSPLDIDIINGAPEERRRFFDSVISKVDPSYLRTLYEFRKVLVARNRVLKGMREKKIADVGELEAWDALFAEKASLVLVKRRDFISRFRPVFMQSYERIGGEDSPDLFYTSTVEKYEADYILARLASIRKKDVAAGVSTLGPQRDDYRIGKSMDSLFVNYASQGQRRTAAISLKAAECEIIERDTSSRAVMLVDDIFSELDARRKVNFIGMLQEGHQVILTMVNATPADIIHFSDCKKFLVERPGIVREI